MENNNIRLVRILATKLAKILNEALVGVYLHGSLAMNFFDWNRSDIDLLIVVNRELNENEKIKIMKIIYEADKSGPKKGIEMSVVLEKYCKNIVYPVPFMLHYSRKYKEDYLNDPKAFVLKMNGTDKDLTAHFNVIYHRGIVLYGEPIKKVFTKVNKSDYVDSILEDIKDAETEIYNKPTYYFLNIVRTLAYLKNNVILSKGEAIYWARENLDEKYMKLVNVVSGSFLNNYEVSYDKDKLQEFVSDMFAQIENLLSKILSDKLETFCARKTKNIFLDN